MVDFLADDSPDLKAWRLEVRSFLKTELPNGMYFDYDYDEVDEHWAAYLEFWRKVGAKGWVALAWPTEYYGLGRSAEELYILQEEFCRYSIPSYPVIGLRVANFVMRFGTPDQRRRHLKGIADVTTLWGEGYTEPQAGSDLAALTTRAHRDGDFFVLNGQKTLGTAAHKCQWMAVLARTDPSSTGHCGISCFLVDLSLPGIEILALENIAGGQQNQTFFDNVRVPADCLIGDEGQAWNQIWFNQGGETLGVFGPAPDPWWFRIERTLKMVIAYAKETSRDGRPLTDDPVVRLQLAELVMGVEIIKLQAQESWSNFRGGRARNGSPVLTSQLHQAYYKEFWPRFAQTCMDILGHASLLSEGDTAPLRGRIEQYFRASFGNHAGGTSQLKRMVMATRGLGLPR